MEWARTVRVDAALDEPERARIAARFSGYGVRATFGPCAKDEPAYLLLEGPEGADPAQMEELVPEGRPFGDAIIALAIEPVPADALPFAADALGGAGRPKGVVRCETRAGELLLEVLPAVTSPALALALVDAEVRRFSGYRRCRLLTPLTTGMVAQIAADSLAAPEIASGRVLETLLGIERVLE